jgi:hypothetical protein
MPRAGGIDHVAVRNAGCVPVKEIEPVVTPWRAVA